MPPPAAGALRVLACLLLLPRQLKTPPLLSPPGQECDLFRARFRALLADEQRAFMEANALPFATLSRPDCDAVREELVATALAVTGSAAAAAAVAQGAAAHEAYYKVPVEQVTDLAGLAPPPTSAVTSVSFTSHQGLSHTYTHTHTT